MGLVLRFRGMRLGFGLGLKVQSRVYEIDHNKKNNITKRS